MSSDLNLSGEQVNCSFISTKVAKIRFVQEKYKQADYFIAGSWGSEPNTVGLWKLADEIINEESDIDYTPKCVSQIQVDGDGDVSGLEFINSETLVCSTTSENGKFVMNPVEFVSFWYFLASLVFSSIDVDQLKPWFDSRKHYN